LRKFLNIKREGEIISEIYEPIREVNDKLLGSDCDIVECLKKARYVAKYFNDIDTLCWIENELKGYSEGYLRDLPPYRKVKAGIYEQKIQHIPLGFEVARRIYKDVKKIIDFPFPLNIEDVILRSREKKGVCELTQYVDEPQFKGQVNLMINVSEFQRIIMEVNIKLSDYIQDKLLSINKIPLETPLMKIFNKFHSVAKNLEKRYNDRDTLVINDEYDTQDLLNALLNIEFNILKKEEYNPAFAGKKSIIDFFLRLENIGIEVKKVRDKTHAGKLSGEIIDDKAKYSNNKEIKELYFFIYDPDSYILNREEFIRDLEKDKPKQFNKVKIIVKPGL